MQAVPFLSSHFTLARYDGRLSASYILPKVKTVEIDAKLRTTDGRRFYGSRGTWESRGGSEMKRWRDRKKIDVN